MKKEEQGRQAEEVQERAGKESGRPMGILTVDAAGAAAAGRMEDTVWHELVNAGRTRKILSGPLSEDSPAVSVNLGSFVAGLSGIGFKLLSASDGGRRLGFSDVYLPVGIHAVGQIDLYSDQFVGLFLAKQPQPVSSQQQAVSAIDIESLMGGKSEDSLGLSVCGLRREVVLVGQDISFDGYLLSDLFGRHGLYLAFFQAERIPWFNFMPAPMYCYGIGLKEPVKGH